MKRLIPFLLGFALSAYVLPWVLMRRPRLMDCAEEDVPPYNFVMTRTDTGHTVTWTWSTE